MFQPQACTDAINIRRTTHRLFHAFSFFFCCALLSDDRTYFDFVLFVIKTVGFRLIYVKSLQKREERKEKSLIITDPVATLAIGGVNFEAEKYGGKAATRKVSKEKNKEKKNYLQTFASISSQIIAFTLYLFECFSFMCVSRFSLLQIPFFSQQTRRKHLGTL